MSNPIRFTFPALCLLVLTSSVRAQSFVFSDFSSTAGLQLNGNAMQVGNTLRVTPAAASQAGTAFTISTFMVEAGFDTTFQFQISSPLSGGADGMAFVIQNDPNGPFALGGNGGPMAYGGFLSCLAVELDTWENTAEGDLLGGNEVSVHTNGLNAVGHSEMFSIGRAVPPVNLSDGLVHTMRIFYVPGTLRIYIDNLTTPFLTIPYDMTTGGMFINNGGPVGGLGLSSFSAFIGFTAASGAASENHDILSWTWNSTNPPDACFSGNVGANSGGPFDVFTINSSTGGILRNVRMSTFQPIRFEMMQPPSNPLPARFALFGLIGSAGAADLYLTPFGTLCIPPSPAFNVPWLFTLANSIPGLPNGPLSAGPAPWAFLAHLGIPYPITCTLQGIIEDAGLAGTTLAVTNGITLEIIPLPAPTVTAVSPIYAVPGTTITVTGTNFQPASVVSVGPVPVATNFVSSTQVTFTCPTGVLCGSAVNVTNPDGQVGTRSYNPQPTISNTIFPSGTSAGGATYIVTGTGFGAGCTATIGGNPANIVTISATAVNMQTPAGITGPAQVVITTPAGCFVTSTYTYL